MKIFEIEKQTKQALINCLEEIPFINSIKEQKRISTSDRLTPDIVLEVGVGKKSKKIILEIKSSGQPKFARNAVNQLLLFKENYPESYGVFAAPYISDSSANICKDADMGYIDVAGNCFVSFENIFIKSLGNPNPAPERKELRSLFSSKSERILRVLIESGSKMWKTQELADEAIVSLGLVSKIKNQLSNREWIISEKVGFELTEPIKLLESWSNNYNYGRNRKKNYYSIMQTGKLEESVSQFCETNKIKFAFTGFSAAARLAPMVRYQKVSLYVQNEEAANQIAKNMKLKQVQSGANLQILIAYDDGVFYQMEKDKEGIVSGTQNYLDLLNEMSRGEEAAEAILAGVIKPKWQ